MSINVDVPEEPADDTGLDEETLKTIATGLAGHTIEETSSGKTIIRAAEVYEVEDPEMTVNYVMDLHTFERRWSIEDTIRALMRGGIPFTIAHSGDEEGVCLVQVGDIMDNPMRNGDPWEELVEAAADAVRSRGEDGDG